MSTKRLHKTHKNENNSRRLPFQRRPGWKNDSAMENENGEPVPDSTAVKTLPASRVLNRLVEISLVKSLYEQVTDIYGRTKDKNFVTKLGFGAVEISAKAALSTTKLGYAVLPSLLKRGFEEKVVSRVDTLASGGLDYLQTKWPVINTEAEKIIAAGINKVEQSEAADVFLTVTEAAIDYVKLSKHEPDRKAVNAGPPTVQTNIDRIRGVTYTVVGEGTKVFWYAASLPGKVTQAGMDGARSAAQWSWERSQNLLDILPDFLKRKQKLRRSKRFKAKAAYHRIVDASDPFPVSPERKRKYDKEGGEDSIEELIYISNDYVSEEDPNYVPEEDDAGESECSDSNDDEQEDAKEKLTTDDFETKIIDGARKRSEGGDAQEPDRKHVVSSAAVNGASTSPRSSSDLTSVKLWSVGPAQKEEEDNTAEMSPNKTEERIAVGPARREKVVRGLATKPDRTSKVSPSKTEETTSVGSAEKEKVTERIALKADHSVKISPNKTEERIAVGPARREKVVQSLASKPDRTSKVSPSKTEETTSVGSAEKEKVTERIALKADHSVKISPNKTEERIAVGPTRREKVVRGLATKPDRTSKVSPSKTEETTSVGSAEKEKVVEKIALKADHTTKGSPSKTDERTASGSMQKEKGGENSKPKTEHIVKGTTHKGGGKCVV